MQSQQIIATQQHTQAKAIVVSSVFSSIAATMLANPFEVIKIRQQIGNVHCHKHFAKSTRLYIQANSIALNFGQVNNVNSFWNCLNEIIQKKVQLQCRCLSSNSVFKTMYQIYRQEGPSTFFNGWRYAIKQATVSNISYFLFYENIKEYFQSSQYNNRYFVPLISSSIARFFTTTLTFPLEYWRVLQSSSQGYTKKMNLSLGSQISSAYMITVQRDVIFSCMFWLLLENAKKELSDRYLHILGQDSINFLSGVMAGVTTATFTLPLDLVKTVQQVSTRSDLQGEQKFKNKGSFEILKQLIDEDGINGLYRGYRARMMKVTVHAGFVYMLYEQLKYQFKRY